MKLSPAAELAVRGILVLAEQYGEGPTTLDAICAKRELPKQYLVKIFSSLTKADLITPVRGKKGGYLLAREPGEVTLLEVIEAVEGPIVLNFCQYPKPKCEEANCPIRPVWTRLQKVVREELGGVTLGACVQAIKHAETGKKRKKQ